MCSWLIEKKKRTIIEESSDNIDAISLSARELGYLGPEKWSYAEYREELIFPCLIISEREEYLWESEILIDCQSLEK